MDMLLNLNIFYDLSESMSESMCANIRYNQNENDLNFTLHSMKTDCKNFIIILQGEYEIIIQNSVSHFNYSSAMKVHLA